MIGQPILAQLRNLSLLGAAGRIYLSVRCSLQSDRTATQDPPLLSPSHLLIFSAPIFSVLIFSVLIFSPSHLLIFSAPIFSAPNVRIFKVAIAQSPSRPVPQSFHILLSRSIALTTFSLSAKAEKRKYPSPAGPNPDPGVPTTLASLSSRSKNSQDVRPFFVFTHT